MRLHRNTNFLTDAFSYVHRQLLLHIRVSTCVDNFILAGNQPVYNTKHSISLPAEGTVLAMSSWDMTCHCHAIASGLKLTTYAITDLGSMFPKYLCSRIQVCPFVLFCVSVLKTISHSLSDNSYT
jgi:hypothetical protein